MSPGIKDTPISVEESSRTIVAWELLPSKLTTTCPDGFSITLIFATLERSRNSLSL